MTANPRQPPGPFATAARATVRFGVRVFLRVYFRYRVIGAHGARDAASRGCVMVANHGSFLDPIVLGSASPRFVSFMINSMSFRSPTMGWFFRLFRSIPVDPRGNNRESLRQARAALDLGEVVGIFPEGGITRDGELLLGNSGAVSLALSKGVSVIPVGIRGVRDALPYGASLPRPRRVEVHFGTPISADELSEGEDRKERLVRATERVMREIAELVGGESREDQLRRKKS